MTKVVEMRRCEPVPVWQRRAIEAVAESIAGEPVMHLDEHRLEVAAAVLPAVLEGARRELQGSTEEEVREALALLAERLELPLPKALALDLDVQLMSRWPRRLFRQAFSRVWQTWTYRRFPGVGDFRQHIEADLTEMQGRVVQLSELELKIQTARTRERWDQEARERHAMDKTLERARYDALQRRSDEVESNIR